MNVKELIKLLQTFPEDAEVWTSYDSMVCAGPIEEYSVIHANYVDWRNDDELKEVIVFSSEDAASLEYCLYELEDSSFIPIDTPQRDHRKLIREYYEGS